MDVCVTRSGEAKHRLCVRRRPWISRCRLSWVRNYGKLLTAQKKRIFCPFGSSNFSQSTEGTSAKWQCTCVRGANFGMFESGNSECTEPIKMTELNAQSSRTKILKLPANSKICELAFYEDTKTQVCKQSVDFFPQRLNASIVIRIKLNFSFSQTFSWGTIVFCDTDCQSKIFFASQKSTARPSCNLIPVYFFLQTPTIDNLAAEGIKLENYYAQPICSPTRGAFLTGRYMVSIHQKIMCRQWLLKKKHGHEKRVFGCFQIGVEKLHIFKHLYLTK